MIANGLMASGLYYFVDKTLWYHWPATERLLHLGFYIFMGILIYGVSLFLLGFRPKHFKAQESF